ncbi:DUF6265 family protein [Sphingomonas sp. ZB1N12]|uniref:DUF6265 family protein n=1 Tax=Sphingomonas arabinosi TaxID=3096160 RepID=UPI002FCAE279
MHFWITILAVAALPASSLAAVPDETRSAAPGIAPPAASIDSLAWLEGSWHGPGLGGDATEVYAAPEAGQITGHFTQTQKGEVAFYELIQIVPVGRSLAYRLRHFNADLTGWEDKTGKPESFPLVAMEKDAVHFDGLTMRRLGPNRIDVWVRIDGKAPREVLFSYTRTR